MSMVPEKDQDPELVRQRTLAQLRLWQVVGIAAAIGGIWIVYSELGQEEQWNSLLRDFIGGPDPQSILLGALIAAGGIALAVWASRTLRRDDGS